MSELQKLAGFLTPDRFLSIVMDAHRERANEQFQPF
jgi:hypothetical protein